MCLKIENTKKKPNTFSWAGIASKMWGCTAPLPHGTFAPLANLKRHVETTWWKSPSVFVNLVNTRALRCCSGFSQPTNQFANGSHATVEYFLLLYICFAMSWTDLARPTRCDHTYLHAHTGGYTYMVTHIWFTHMVTHIWLHIYDSHIWLHIYDSHIWLHIYDSTYMTSWSS